MEQPKKPKVPYTGIYLDDRHKRALDTLAKKEGRNRSNMVQALIRRAAQSAGIWPEDEEESDQPG